MQREMQAFVEFVNRELLNRSGEDSDRAKTALARITPARMIRPVKK